MSASYEKVDIPVGFETIRERYRIFQEYLQIHTQVEILILSTKLIPTLYLKVNNKAVAQAAKTAHGWQG